MGNSENTWKNYSYTITDTKTYNLVCMVSSNGSNYGNTGFNQIKCYINDVEISATPTKLVEFDNGNYGFVHCAVRIYPGLSLKNGDVVKVSGYVTGFVYQPSIIIGNLG